MLPRRRDQQRQPHVHGVLWTLPRGTCPAFVFCWECWQREVGLAPGRQGSVDAETGDDLGLPQHQALNLEPGDEITTADGSERPTTTGQ